MNARLLVVAMFVCVGAGPLHAADPTVKISEQTLNNILNRVGTISDGGVAQPFNVHERDPIWEFCFTVGIINCPGGSKVAGISGPGIPTVVCHSSGGGTVLLPVGDPISWHWWVSNAFLKITSDGMTFTATVVARVGNSWQHETQTVDASLQFEPSTSRLMLHIDRFTVPLAAQGAGLSLDAPPVDVSRLFRLSVGVAPHSYEVPLPSGGSRQINARVVGASADYQSGEVKVTFDARF